MLQLISSVLSVLAGWFGLRKAVINARAAHGVAGSRAATPFTSLVYRWSGSLSKPKSQELILHVGNQEPRAMITHELLWSAPHARVKWPATCGAKIQGVILRQGEGTDFALDPNDTLNTLMGSRYCNGFFLKLVIVCGLHLVVALQSGESIHLRAPRAYRSLLAETLGFGWFGRSVVRLQSYAWP